MCYHTYRHLSLPGVLPHAYLIPSLPGYLTPFNMSHSLQPTRWLPSPLTPAYPVCYHACVITLPSTYPVAPHVSHLSLPGVLPQPTHSLTSPYSPLPTTYPVSVLSSPEVSPPSPQLTR